MRKDKQPQAVEAWLARMNVAGPFTADWESLRAYSVPSWYQKARFGIFIHWGPYAVPAFDNEWYSRNMYQPQMRPFAYHRSTYGDQRDFGYKDFLPHFTGEHFDAAAWMALFKEAGARFVVPVAEHHDGFAMYACSFSRWNAVEQGPRRDVLGALTAAAQAAGLVAGLSYHRAEHWWFFNGGRLFPSDVQDPRYADLYGPARAEEEPPDAAFLDEWLARLCELVERYQPHLVYFDWWIEQPVFAPYLQRFAAYYYNRAAQWGEEVVITYKEPAFAEGTAVCDVERGSIAEISPRCWQADTSIARNSWGYTSAQDYKDAGQLIGDLIDVVSKNGVLLLNVGPRADGTIPEEEARVLRAIGAWLRINGEAIYGSRPWTIYGEGPTGSVQGRFSESQQAGFTGRDMRFTVRGETLYALLPVWPDDDRVYIRALATGGAAAPRTIADVRLLGAPQPLRWERDAGGLRVELPALKPCEHGGVLRISPTTSPPAS